MPKGSKECPNCGGLTGVRTKLCSCGHKFFFRPSIKRKKGESIKDWKELEKGDEIRTVQGTGSYCVCQNGERYYFPEKGILKVWERQSEGIVVHGRNGFGYVYMGEPYYCEDTDTHRNPYKIRLVRKVNRQ